MATDYFNNSRYDHSESRTVRVQGGSEYKASPRVKSSGTVPENRKPVKAVRTSTQSYQGPGFLYDARGVRVRKSRLSNEFVRTLLFFVLPYLVINAIIFVIVTATPKVEVNVGNTNNYTSSTAKFTVSCLLPIKEVVATIDSEPVEFTKQGSTYTAHVTKNGTFCVEASAVNGMHALGYTDVSLLDDMPPAIDETSCHIEAGVLTFRISDSQSGVDWSSIYALSENGEKSVPLSIEKESGTVAIQMLEDKMEICFADMVGNTRSANITANSEQMSVQGPVTE